MLSRVSAGREETVSLKQSVLLSQERKRFCRGLHTARLQRRFSLLTCSLRGLSVALHCALAGLYCYELLFYACFERGSQLVSSGF